MRFAVLALVLLLALSAPAAAAPAPIQYTRSVLNDGTFESTTLEGNHVVLNPGAVSGTWTSANVSAAAFTRLVASWNAETPAAGQLTVQAQVTTVAGETSDWYTLGVWASGDSAVQRTSINGQADRLGRVATDTLSAQADPFTAYTLRVRLERAGPADPSPTLWSIGAEVSDFAYSAGQATSRPMSTEPVELDVPRLSQEIHARQYPQWGGGGEAWCSPTSTEMVVEFWGRAPSADDLAWVDPADADPGVDFAARSTYDAAYRGTGNWPFNAAYAARYGLDAFVTQLRSLSEAEQFVRAGIPLVA